MQWPIFLNDGDAFRANVDTCKDIGNNDFLFHVDATNLDTDPSEGVDLLNELNDPILSEGVDTGEDTNKETNNDRTGFKLGQTFVSYLQLKQATKQYELGNHIQLRTMGSLTLEAAKKAVPKRVADANPTLRYY